MKKKKIFVLLIILGFLLSFGVVVAATSTSTLQNSIEAQNQAFAGKNGANLGDPKDTRVIVANIIKVFLGFLGFLATTYLVYGGYMYMTSAGNDQRADKASKIMFYSALGLFIILASYSITLFVFNVYQKSLEQSNVPVQEQPNSLFLPQ